MAKTLKRTLAKALKQISKNRVYTVRNGLATGMKRKGGLGFLPKASTPEDEFVRGLELRDKTVYDIGGYEGIFTLFFAKSSGPNGQVHVFEPHPSNRGRIEENVRLNNFTNVSLHPVGIGHERGELTMVCRLDETATATFTPSVQESIRAEGNTTTITARVEPLDHMVFEEKVPPPGFVKIDTEGYELMVLRGAERTLAEYRPEIYLEVHGATWDERKENSRAITEFLLNHGYDVYSVEAGEYFKEAELRNAFHLYCTPAERGAAQGA